MKKKEIKKTFILGKHHADLLQSSERRLVFELSNDDTFNTTLVTLNTKSIKKLGKMIYDRVMLIDKYVATVNEITGITVIHNDQDGREIYNTTKGRLVVTVYESNVVGILVYAGNEICERISFKINEVETE